MKEERRRENCPVISTYTVDSAGERRRNVNVTSNKWVCMYVCVCVQGLLPWALIEASTKGAVLFAVQNEVSHALSSTFGLGHTASGLLGGACGGVAQAYTTMGFCTLMKTVEVTRSKSMVVSVDGAAATASPHIQKTTLQVAADIIRREGIAGMYRGVNALAMRQFTNWGSRFGISRAAEDMLRGGDARKKLSTVERLSAAAVGGSLACWNHPIEVIRIELQRHDGDRAAGSRSIFGAAKNIYSTGGLPAFFRGVTPRIGHSLALTILMVFGGDELKARAAAKR